MGNVCVPRAGSADPTVRESGDFRHEMVWERQGRNFDDVYETIKKLGEGAMGTVALVRKRPDANRSLARSASDSELKKSGDAAADERRFAAKVVPFAEAGGGGRSPAKRAARLAELRHEIDVLRRVDHPNVVHLREAFWEAERLVLVMELCEGTELSAFATTLGEDRLCAVAEQVLRAVAYLHARGVVHRDLKLENVRRRGRVPRARPRERARRRSWRSTRPTTRSSSRSSTSG